MDKKTSSDVLIYEYGGYESNCLFHSTQYLLHAITSCYLRAKCLLCVTSQIYS